MVREEDIKIKEVIAEGEKFYEATVEQLPNIVDYGYTEEEARRLILETIDMLKESKVI